MKFFVFLVYVFVNTFGITQPTPEGARRAARYLSMVSIVILLLSIGAAVEIRLALRP